jgi:hypothetical protein
VGPDERRRKLEEWKQRQMEKRRRWQENMQALHQQRMLRILSIQEKHGMLRANRSEPRLLVSQHAFSLLLFNATSSSLRSVARCGFPQRGVNSCGWVCPLESLSQEWTWSLAMCFIRAVQAQQPRGR